MPNIRKTTTQLAIVIDEVNALMAQRIIKDRNDVYFIVASQYDDFQRAVHFYYTLAEVNCNEDFDW